MNNAAAPGKMEPGPGALLKLLRTYLDRGENVEVCYMTSEARWVVGTEPMRKEMPGIRVPESGTGAAIVG